MAAVTLISSKKSSVGSPYAYYTFTAEETARTSTTVTIKLTAKGRLATSSSTFRSGLGLKAGVYIGGAWRVWTLKSTSSSWSGTSWHSASTTVSISVSASTTALTGIKVRVLRSDSNGSSCKLSATNATTPTLSIAKSAIFTVSYNANGGPSAPAAQTKAYDEIINLSSDILTRPDEEIDGVTVQFNFLGWSQTADGTTVDYLPGAAYSLNQNITLYAVWATIDGYLIIYNTQGGSLISQQDKPAGGSVNITTQVPTLKGYDFIGWSLTPDGTEIAYAGGESYSTDAHLTLYAIWEPWTHTIVFNGGDGVEVPSSMEKTTGIDIVIPAAIPEREGFLFTGWSLQKDSNKIDYNPKDTYSRTQDGGIVTLYAIWTIVEVTFYNNGLCKALEFREGANQTSFFNDGSMETIEIIERKNGKNKIDNSSFFVNELIEKHNYYKIINEEEKSLTDHFGNSLYYIE